MIVNDLRLAPIPVATGIESYPDDIPEKIRNKYPRANILDGMELASQAGDLRTVNTVLLGALSCSLELSADTWQQALENMVPNKFLELNRKAFALGQKTGS